ncbi:iron complex outermembrane recepter protein [Reichenbachiella faecimaris]|uniref:Iron complex outermembrane recepter protein n=1 Tax=Reichenbachiella faecimaris TaxID=692418 RepID=A0A1W2GFU7_REIFA|nr:TonB-dependent receptor [Reichenbachiella faecimaris]SMD35136.1 iron complex outermembrane recepter protein [Reichenbachiella faecimaris]
MPKTSTRLIFLGLIFSYSLLAASGREGKYDNIKNTKVSLVLEEATIVQAFEAIEKLTPFRFAYDIHDVDADVRINNPKQTILLADLLLKISEKSQLKFKQINKTINVYKVRTNVDAADEPRRHFKVSGKILNEEDGLPLAGVSVRVSGSQIGIISDTDGNFELTIPGKTARISISYVGFETIKLDAESSMTNLHIEMKTDLQSLNDVVVVGTRFNPRSVLDSPVPIDNISSQELEATGQLTLDQMINFKMQSFNASQQTVSDATAHFNPADLRGLGPSRTLVLINGKRKNPSALVYINDTPGKGEVGVDMQSIPIEAVERVEILRDGASAQYGSDAIAGVINIILKEEAEQTTIKAFSGITTKGDGFNYGFSANTGFDLLAGGFLNITTSYKQQEYTNRAGKPGEDKFFDEEGFEEWVAENPDLGMIVGQPDMSTFDVFYNAEVPLNNHSELYSFGGITLRQGTSFALYRTPYWVPDPDHIFHKDDEVYKGFHPTFETDISDRTLGLGIRSEIREWDVDISAVSGTNTVAYHIGETMNPTLGRQSPTRFDAGGYQFRNLINNIDLFRRIDNFNIGFGSEFRTELFEAFAGEEDSYQGGGSISFPGIRPADEVDENRFNVGVYTDVEFDNKVILVGGAARFENYDDFGKNFTWKFNARYRPFGELVSLRASASTGFRAPSLHQIHLSNVQTLVSDGTISNQGTFNNNSPIIRELEVPNLTQENSLNFSGGITLQPFRKLEFTCDYYDIRVNNRILFTNEIGSDGNPNTLTALEDTLKSYNVTSLKFFINAADTRTKGVDGVLSYKEITLGSGLLDVSFAGNLTTTSIESAIRTPDPLAASGNEIFNRKEQARILSARPSSKFLLALDYGLGKLSTGLRFTRFGEVTWRHATDPLKDQTYSSKIITDISINYKLSQLASFGISINNLLNVYPDEIDAKGDPLTNLGGRFRYAWEVNQFGYLGTVISAKLSVNFK